MCGGTVSQPVFFAVGHVVRCGALTDRSDGGPCLLGLFVYLTHIFHSQTYPFLEGGPNGWGCSTTDLCIQSRQLPHVEELLEQALQDSDSLRCGQMEV